MEFCGGGSIQDVYVGKCKKVKFKKNKFINFAISLFQGQEVLVTLNYQLRKFGGIKFSNWHFSLFCDIFRRQLIIVFIVSGLQVRAVWYS